MYLQAIQLLAAAGTKSVLFDIAVSTVSTFLGTAATVAGQIVVEKYFGLHDKEDEAEEEIHTILVEEPLTLKKPPLRAPRLKVGKPDAPSEGASRIAKYRPFTTKRLRTRLNVKPFRY
jgi:hypothetical protein